MGIEADESERSKGVQMLDECWVNQLVRGKKEGEVLNNARWNFCPGRERVTCLCV